MLGPFSYWIRISCYHGFSLLQLPRVPAMKIIRALHCILKEKRNIFRRENFSCCVANMDGSVLKWWSSDGWLLIETVENTVLPNQVHSWTLSVLTDICTDIKRCWKAKLGICIYYFILWIVHCHADKLFVAVEALDGLMSHYPQSISNRCKHTSKICL